MKNVEDILPLSPMQELMLLHLAAAHGSEALLEQNAMALTGDVNPAQLREAWQRVVHRHAALRAAFLWKGLSKPIQAIRQQVELPWQDLDWSTQPPAAQKENLQSLLAEDRRKGFDPTQAPLLRITLIRTNPDAWWMVMSAHHILIDRWSVGLMLGEVLTIHAALRGGQEPTLSPARPYKEYLEHLGKQKPEEVEAHWKSTLTGLAPAVPLVGEPEAAVSPGDAVGLEQFALPPGEAQRLRDYVQQNHLTLNTVVQATLAGAMARLLGRQDIVLGITLSSRPAEIAGVEKMVGMFSNNLPFRVRLPREKPLADWLKELQEQQMGLAQYASSSLASVQQCAGIAADQPLFECLLVFQNDPAAEALQANDELKLKIQGVGGHSRTNYPLTVMVVPAHVIELSFLHDRGRLGRAWVKRLTQAIQESLKIILDRPQATVGDLLGPATAAPKRSAADRFVSAVNAGVVPTTPVTSKPVVNRTQEVAVPNTPTEKAIAQVWREVLNRQDVSVHDMFFDIGGTSMLALQAVERLRKNANLKLNLMELAGQTLGQLATACEARAR